MSMSIASMKKSNQFCFSQTLLPWSTVRATVQAKRAVFNSAYVLGKEDRTCQILPIVEVFAKQKDQPASWDM